MLTDLGQPFTNELIYTAGEGVENSIQYNDDLVNGGQRRLTWAVEGPHQA